MADEQKFLTQDIADELLKKHSAQVVSTIDSYPVMDQTAEGSWRVVEEDNTPVGVLWTDWASSAGLVVIKPSEKTKEIEKYFSTNKSLGELPGMAYGSAQLIDGLQFSEEYSGTLDSVMVIATQLTENGEK